MNDPDNPLTKAGESWPEAPVADPSKLPPVQPWGAGLTLVFSLCIFAGAILVQVLVVVLFAIASQMRGVSLSPEAMATDGLVLALATCGSAPVAVLMSLLFVHIRRGCTIQDYLGLSWPEPRLFRYSCLAILVLILMSDGLTALLGRPIVPEFMTQIYNTARFAPMLWMALIVAAPLSEEFLFRGFLYQGLSQSPIGPPGAIVTASLLWAAIHTQYDLYGMLSIFVSGLVLGYARWKTGSLYPPIVMHALMNVIATVEVIGQSYYLR